MNDILKSSNNEKLFSRNLNVFDMDKGEFVTLDVNSLFDASKYHSMKAVTYVASPALLEKYVSKFDFAEIIIGIDDSETCESIAKGIIKNFSVNGLEFFEESSQEMKNRIVEDTLKLRFGKNGVVIHSKIYLLEGEDEFLVIMGSSNLTKNAFGIGKKQYEDVFISRSKMVYDSYMERYSHIYEDTLDYIPTQSKKLWEKENRVASLDEKADIRLAYFDENRDALDVETEDVKELTLISRNESNSPAKEAERTVTVIKKVTGNAQNKKKAIVPKELLKAAKPSVSKINVTKYNEDESNWYPRTELIYSENENQIFGTRPGIDTGNSSNWSEPLSKEQIEERLKSIESLLDVYDEFGKDTTVESKKKAFEIILHAFFSPFMWKMRRDCQNYYDAGGKSIATSVPNILIINGVAECGKTALLSAINKLMQNSDFEIPNWKEYKKVKNDMDNKIHENNIYPLIIDEIESDFLASGNARYKGEEWIKNMSNEIGDKVCPYIITATNKSIDLSSPLRRRVHYISMTSVVGSTAAVKAAFAKAIESMDNLLFKDFCYRILQKIQKNETLYDVSKEYNGIHDYIYPAREIFAEYYKECGLEIPEFLSMEPFDDYSYNGKNMWRDTFNDKTCKDAFSYVEQNNELIVNMEILSNKQYSKKADKLKAYLNDYVKKYSDMTESTYQHLDADKFFEWIGMENPYAKKKGFFQKMFSKK